MSELDPLNQAPFIPFGAQYYRAPTPLPEQWARDLDRFAEAGFNTLKYWAQWRWNTPGPGLFHFRDLDELMDLAAERGLRVVINTIFDCAPAWLFHEHPDCLMIRADGMPVKPRVTACRQIGGAPGPCLNHPEARRHRLDFLAATVRHFAGHPALWVWDTWNEPELIGGVERGNDPAHLTCYCAHCRARFIEWLKAEYGDLEDLNERWFRKYRSWDELELPIFPHGFIDMLDWRRFQIATLSGEQRERVEVTRREDPNHAVMCHTVPMPWFNPVFCGTDEWELAKPGDLAGNSICREPWMADIIRSAAPGKMLLSAEIHAVGGSSLSRPRPLSLAEVKRYIWLPLAHGVKGFLYWQYRPELLGAESPAWGLTHEDGSPTPWFHDNAAVNAHLQQHRDFFFRAENTNPEVGLLYHPANHILCWCASLSFDVHDRAVRGAWDALYRAGFRVRYVHPADLAAGRHNDLRAICYPFPYVLDGPSAEALRAWVAAGGTLVGEAFFGACHAESGLHAMTTPGQGLDEVFGARFGFGVPFSAAVDFYQSRQQVRTLRDQPVFTLAEPVGRLRPGTAMNGYLTATPIEPRGARTLAAFAAGQPALTAHDYGEGRAFLFGTLVSCLGGLDVDVADLLGELLATGETAPRPLAETGSPDDTVRVDVLRDGARRALVVDNVGSTAVKARLNLPGVPAGASLIEALGGGRIAAENGTWTVELAPRAAELYHVAD